MAAASDDHGSARAVVFLRPTATPLPMGLIALACATMTLSALQLGWVPATERTQVALVLLVGAPLPQLVASIFGFLGRDTVVGSGMGWLSATWLAYGLVLVTTPPRSTSVALGAYLLVVAAAFVTIVGGAGSQKGVPALVMGTAGLRFAVSGVYEVTSSSGWEHAAGWVGVALCVLALYGALALSLEDLRRGFRLPTLRTGAARAALDEPLAEQAREAYQAPGVRRQL